MRELWFPLLAVFLGGFALGVRTGAGWNEAHSIMVLPETRSEARGETQAQDGCEVRVKQLRASVARLRADTCPVTGSHAGVVAVVESVGRMLAINGEKELDLSRIKRVLLLMGKRADLEAWLRCMEAAGR